MIYKYIRKKADAGGWSGVRVLHTIGFDGETSRCGAVHDGDAGYEIVERGTKALSSLTCSNCLNMKISPKEE